MTSVRIPHVAYFSMEIALQSDVPTYSGGLGVLAGDTLRSAADLALPVTAVTLASRSGYFRQQIEGGRQLEHPQAWNPADHARHVPVKVPVRVGAREVWVTAWEWRIESHCAESQPVSVLLLDTDLPENHPEDRALTGTLYGGDAAYRLAQEMVLGIGGVRLLAAIGCPVEKYHLNEGHAALLTLELLREQMERSDCDLDAAIEAVRRRCVFTTHTPVPAGHDQFEHDLVHSLLGTLASAELLRRLGGAERLNMTLVALELSGWVNGVAQRHAEVSRAMFPGFEVHAITNGVHPWTWASDGHRALFDQHVPHWCHEPELLIHASRIPLEDIARAHARAKASLLAHAQRVAEPVALAPDCLTIGFARRMTSYKRPLLLFSDLARLRRIARRYPLQIVMAGKAHPRDWEGKQHIEQLHAIARELEGEVPLVFLPGYDMDLGRQMTAGVDLWLNTPQRPLEASGTSGMKAALNGVPNLSVLDGWWLEGWEEGVTGWAVGPDGPHDPAVDSLSLHDQLEQVIAPLFYEDPQAWLHVCREAIARNGSQFNSHRMLRRYVLEAYTR
ncbi:alpha-glucan family phosphorylase [Ramlibacter rhizophilus]|uniref:glycogen phosphorylase n=1 Tax=Ramlibacter rhizophilus TaxID=1781167 RepID=A0A4Z0C1J9_9BURK|nr:alpha-glucan family phosphorylase [Ramlibacter rhizophilus]TFZ04380.1 alpha-glucan family phosphorylase [Ramlibacter rhizophilus]